MYKDLAGKECRPSREKATKLCTIWMQTVQSIVIEKSAESKKGVWRRVVICQLRTLIVEECAREQGKMFGKDLLQRMPEDLRFLEECAWEQCPPELEMMCTIFGKVLLEYVPEDLRLWLQRKLLEVWPGLRLPSRAILIC